MQRREKMLIVGLLAAIVIWRGWPIANRVLFGGLEEKRSQLRAAELQAEQKELDEMEVIRATARMKTWKDASLPPDPLDAQRLYQQWLTDLAQLAGWRQPKVAPGRRAAQGKVYTAVQVQVDGAPTFDQLLRFFYYFHRADLLHRITQLSVTRPVQGNSDVLEVTLLAEGLALHDAPPRATLFPHAVLGQDLSSTGTVIEVDNVPSPLPPPPFVIRLQNELAQVVQVDQKHWTVQRGVDGTSSGRYSAGQMVEVVPIDKSLASTSLGEFQSRFEQGPFRPYRDAPPRLAAVRSQDAYFGRTLSFTVTAEDPDTASDQLRYSMRNAPRGANLNSQTGEFTWTPDSSLSPRRYDIEFVVSDGGAPPQTASRRVTVNLHEDPAESTFLVGSVATDQRDEVWLLDTKQNQKMELHTGDTFTVADISGEIVEITDEEILLRRSDGSLFRLRLGDNLRAMRPVADTEAPPAADAGQG